MLNTRLCVAYSFANRGEEYFRNHIRKTVENGIGADDDDSTPVVTEGGEEIDEVGNIPVFGSTALLMKNEHLLSECNIN